MRIFATASFALSFLICCACGGSSHSSTLASGPLSGNWQFNLTQAYPSSSMLSVSGFLSQSSDTLTGSVQTPAEGTKVSCGGVSSLTGTVNGQSLAFTLDEGGTILNFTATVSSDNQSMTGNYQAIGGACFTKSTTGTFTAMLVPPLNGSFTGILMSTYVEMEMGAGSQVAINVSGTMAQSPNAGASNATLTGTINAVDYPCFSTATLTGTISGQNVYLQVFGYNGAQIGIIGSPSAGAGSSGTPALVTLASGSNAVSLVGSGGGDLSLGEAGSGPCPPLPAGSTPINNDLAVPFDLTFQ